MLVDRRRAGREIRKQRRLWKEAASNWNAFGLAAAALSDAFVMLANHVAVGLARVHLAALDRSGNPCHHEAIEVSHCVTEALSDSEIER